MLVGALIVVLVTLLVVAAVAWPLLSRPAEDAPADPHDEARRSLEEDLERSLASIREIEMDHRAGNLSDEDFAALDAAERARAVDLMRRRDELEAQKPGPT